MKKLIAALALILVLLLFAASAFGQSVGASQIKRKTNAGLVADSANALAVGVYRGTSAPASPVTGQLWLDTTTTPATPRTWNGSAWDVLPMGGAIVVASLADLPASPGDGRLGWITSMLRSVVYDSASSAWYYLDGRGAKAVGTYSLAVSGFSSSFLPAAGATSGSVAAGGSVTVGTHVCAVSYYHSTGGETMAGTPTATLTTTSGNQTLALSFAASVTGSAGKRIWCSKNGATNPLWLIATIDDTSTASYNVTVIDTSFGVATSPDVDFSAPIPSGWTVQRTGAGYGGCGSTGASLLCATYAHDAYGVGALGVRLTYAVDAGMTEWRARMRVIRADRGFAGATVAPVYATVVGLYSASSNAVAAPDARGLGIHSSTSAIFPYGSGGITTPVKHSRAIGAAWSNSTVASSMGIEEIAAGTLPHWAEQITYWDGSTWDTRWGASSGGTDFAYWAAEALTWKPAHLGVAVERAMSSANITSAVLEFDSFTVEPF